MKYENIVRGKFKERPNRFIASVCVEGNEERAHVKNTGRCRELLEKDADIYLEDHIGEMGKRKLRYSLIAVEKKTERGTFLVNMDSQAPNTVAWEWLRLGKLFSAEAVVRREVRFGDSRLDFYIEDGEKKCYMEVKGVTLEDEGTAAFPDAPTERGVRHLEELIRAAQRGYEAYLLFVVQMQGVKRVVPNENTHPTFAKTLRKAALAGVKILAIDCRVTADSLESGRYVPVEY